MEFQHDDTKDKLPTPTSICCSIYDVLYLHYVIVDYLLVKNCFVNNNEKS